MPNPISNSASALPAGPQTLAGALWPAATPRSAALRAAVLVGIGVASLTLSAKIQVPLGPVPMTMQTLVVLLLGAGYGARLGAAAVLAYLCAGLAGLPVFANTPPAAPGPAYFFGPTGGFLLGFVLAAVSTGLLAERGWDRSLPRATALMLLGHAVIFLAGLAWLATLAGPVRAWEIGGAPFIYATLLKAALGVALLRGGRLWFAR